MSGSQFEKQGKPDADLDSGIHSSKNAGVFFGMACLVCLVTMSFLLGYWFAIFSDGKEAELFVPHPVSDSVQHNKVVNRTTSSEKENNSNKEKQWDNNESFDKVRDVTNTLVFKRERKVQAKVSKNSPSLEVKKKKIKAKLGKKQKERSIQKNTDWVPLHKKSGFVKKKVKKRMKRNFSKKKQYFLQVSAHVRKENALRLRDALIREGHSAQIIVKKKNKKNLYLVRVGPLLHDKVDMAKKKLSRYKETENAFIVR